MLCGCGCAAKSKKRSAGHNGGFVRLRVENDSCYRKTCFLASLLIDTTGAQLFFDMGKSMVSRSEELPEAF